MSNRVKSEAASGVPVGEGGVELARKLLVVLLVVTFILATASIVFANSSGPMGPAPNAGDGISDGSGFEPPIIGGRVGYGSEPKGPAPNSGDGIPDGSGF